MVATRSWEWSGYQKLGRGGEAVGQRIQNSANRRNEFKRSSIHDGDYIITVYCVLEGY
jgi:hypothetical protein